MSRTITFMGFMMPKDGYGYGTIKIAERLASRYDLIDMTAHGGGLGCKEERQWWLDGKAVALCTPDWLARIDAADGLISYTMFEATKLPEGWADKINQHSDRLLVPCQWCAEMFHDNGVHVPIDVVKWGIDPEDYWPLERLHGSRPYTFLWSGTPDLRKGYDVAYRAFYRAFGHHMGVRLVMHFRHKPPGLAGASDPNVTVVAGMFDRPVLRSMLARADAFVFPSRGEGWGSPPREAAATGLPVIATDWGGLAEEIEQWAYPLNVTGRMSPAVYGFWDDIGEWAEPDVDHLTELMRWCYEHQSEAAAFGQQAARWLAKEATWDRTAQRLIEIVE